ncbi:hypothetical protein ABZS88_45735 [Streptomyces sp. NPDC005480]|uniref:AMP-binding enzyme n=1 Tax=Streptomyces sp. NPDC005480 TaxID=3154880 RepID=UPI0033B9949B
MGADRPDRPSHSPTGKRGCWPTPANAVVDMPAAPARRRHEHREHTVGRLAEVLGTGPPAVSMAAVIGVPHESRGEEVKACVVLNPGADLTEDQLIAWCKQAMATYKYPRLVAFLDTLPMNATGKILKRQLRPAPDGDRRSGSGPSPLPGDRGLRSTGL